VRKIAPLYFRTPDKHYVKSSEVMEILTIPKEKKMRTNVLAKAAFVLAVVCVTSFICPLQAAVIYVAPGGEGTGAAWSEPANLKTAMTNAKTGDQIWAKTGIYKPGVSRDDTFALKKGLAVYGGFIGTETELSERDWVNNKTVLSGDIGEEDDNADNCYNVVTGGSGAQRTDNTAILDGFTITKGYADGMFEQSKGGGIYIRVSSPVIRNCTIVDNIAEYGGGMYNDGSSPTITNCTFIGNRADIEGSTDNWGGGMANNSNSSPQITNCMFQGNHAGSNGGGIHNTGSSSPSVTNSIFVGNHAETNGGGIFSYQSVPTVANCTFSQNAVTTGSGGGFYVYGNDTPSISNSIFWGNTAAAGKAQNIYPTTLSTVKYCLVQGGYSGVTNISGDPVFVAAPSAGDDDWTTLEDNDYGDLHLQGGSPAIDKGSNNLIPAGVTIDLDGEDRIFEDGTVDMGAYEYIVLPPTLTSFTPLLGGSGTQVVITGTNFMKDATEVKFGVTDTTPDGTAAASVTVDSETQITVTVAAGTPTGNIMLTTPGGTVTSASAFTFVPAPVISGFDPAVAGTSEAVTITGTNLAGATAVVFGITDTAPDGTAASVSSNTETEIIAAVGAGTVTGKISVTTPGGTATNENLLTIDEPPAVVEEKKIGEVAVENTGTSTSTAPIDLTGLFTDPDDEDTQIQITAESDNEDVVTVTLEGNTLKFAYHSACGTANITIRATSGERTSDYQFPVMVSPIDGDVNCDTKVDLKDALLVLKVLTGKLAESDTVYNADADGDGKVGIKDLIFILKEIRG
jgi:hypothetical protein